LRTVLLRSSDLDGVIGVSHGLRFSIADACPPRATSKSELLELVNGSPMHVLKPDQRRTYALERA